MVVYLVSFLLIVITISLSIKLLFTHFVFNLLGFNPLLLHFFAGNIPSEDMVSVHHFTTAEVAHLNDISALLTNISPIILPLIIFALLLTIMRKLSRFKTPLTALILMSGVCIAQLSSYFFCGWQCLSYPFRTTVFPQGNWRFPETATLNQLYGTQVMQQGYIFVILSSVILLTLLTLLGWYIKRKK